MLINVNYVRDKYVAGFLLHIGHAGLPGPRLGRAEQVAILMHVLNWRMQVQQFFIATCMKSRRGFKL